MTGSPDLDWNRIDRAVDIMKKQGLRDVRAQGQGPHIAVIDYEYPVVVPWMTDDHAFGSSAEVNTANKVVNYTMRFPAIQDIPDAPDKDEISVALTGAAEKLPEGRRVDVVPRAVSFGRTVYAPHIRGDTGVSIRLMKFARLAVQVGDEFYDRLGI